MEKTLVVNKINRTATYNNITDKFELEKLWKKILLVIYPQTYQIKFYFLFPKYMNDN